jgi:hypothetical protein
MSAALNGTATARAITETHGASTRMSDLLRVCLAVSTSVLNGLQKT